MRDTISVLAGYAGTDRWVMTAALLLVGGFQVATGAGLTAVRLPARLLLIVTGLSTLGIAATPELATGPTSRHLAFAVSCVVTTAVWPVLVARRAPAPSWILSVYGAAVMTAVFAGLSSWLLIAARTGAGDLGLAERLTSAVQALFPLVVALALRRAPLGRPGRLAPGRQWLGPGASGRSAQAGDLEDLAGVSRGSGAGAVVGHVDGTVGPDGHAGRLEQAAHRQRGHGVPVVADPDQSARGGGRRQQTTGAVLGGQEPALMSKAMAVTAVRPRAQIFGWWPGTTR